MEPQFLLHQTVLIYIFLCLISRAEADEDSIITKGSHFFHKNGSQFFIRGLHYHDYRGASPAVSSYVDLLADRSICTRDIPYLVRLGINTLFVTNTDPRLDHSVCMRLLEEAGMYVLISPWNRVGISALNLPTWEKGGQISFPYDYRYWDYVFSHVDAFHQYPNTLGFIIPLADLSAPQVRKIPWSKAMVRDVKEYIRMKGYRSIPVSSATYQYQLSTVPQYMSCGDRSSSVDFLGLDLTYMENVKTECRNVSSWLEDGKVEEYLGYSIPTYLLYGCNVNLRKDFSEIQAIFSNSTTKAFSGVILFEWLDDSEAWADFGLVEVKGGNVTLRPGYTALSSQLAIIRPSSTEISSYTPTNVPPSLCHNFTSGELLDPETNVSVKVHIATNLPSRPSRRLCSCMMETTRCIPNQNNTEPASKPLSEEDICKKNMQWCDGVAVDEAEGTYDSFRTCRPLERWSWAINQAYMAKGGNDAAACSSLGGVTQRPIPSASQASDCRILLEQAGPAGTGTITFTPTPPPSGGSTTTKSKGGSLSEGTKFGIEAGIPTLFVLVLSGMLWRIFRARKKHKKNFSSAEIEDESRKPELEGNPVSLQKKGLVEQLDSHEVNELKGDAIVAEVEADGEIHELYSELKPVELESPSSKET